MTSLEKPTNTPLDRPDWAEYFLKLAKVVSERSPDGETKHGCVIVNDFHQVIGVGYNGFVRGIDDSLLPNLRPAKYLHMIHAEVNRYSKLFH